MDSPALTIGTRAVRNEAVPAGIVHHGFIDGGAIVIVIAAMEKIDIGADVEIVCVQIHLNPRATVGHLNLDVLHEEEVLARRMVHVALDERGGLDRKSVV